ncbi:hypothetical protein [Poseidonia sp.]|uniref:hypothetical protein n=1 Tax=Poseidonia sp. TaxID=2666344 RepID=UPI003F6A37D2
MALNQKSKTFVMVILFLLASFTTFASGDETESLARSTGNEEIIISVTGDYYDRGGEFTFTITSKNLDPNSEYTLTWELCTVYSNQCEFHEGGNDPVETDGTIDLGSGNAIQVSTITFTDPGLYTSTLDPNDPGGNIYIEEGIENNSYRFESKLSIQGVQLDENLSNLFVLGGEVYSNSYLNGNGNLIKNMPVPFNGRFYLDWQNYNILDFDINCGLYEGTGTTPVDTYDFASKSTSGNYINFNYGAWNTSTVTAADLVPTASSGTHHIECSITRLADNTVMHTIIGNDFEVIDDTSNQDDASMAVSVAMHATEGWGTVTISAVDLDAGQEYRFDWVVNDNTVTSWVVLEGPNDHIWVAGNDGTHSYDLPFHDLADTTDACITVVFKAGTTELATDSSVCWISASTADADGDGVYDKNDLCENTPASATVQSDGCSDSDGDGVDSTIETECGSDPNDINSVPTDLDNDGTCDLLDTDADGDGALNVDEIAAGTDPMDANSFPANMLPTCAVYYSLEVDGMPTTFDGDAAIPALSGATAQAGVNSLTPPVITVPAGSYYITAHCIDTDGDDITVTVNDISVGPVAGEVSAGAIIVIGEDVDETLDVTISWTDGTDTLTAIITVNMDGDSGPTTIPGFGFMLGMMSIMLAGFVALRRKE